MTDLLTDQAHLGAPEPIDPEPGSIPDAGIAVRMVLDTSVLISDPDSITAFPDADVIIPLVVVEELDQHKSRLDDVGRAARAVIRAIEELRVGNGGDIRTAVALPTGGTLRIETNGLHLNEIREHGLDPTKNDNRILAASLGQAAHGRTVVVSNDAALRIKAAQLGLEAMEHQRLRGRAMFERPVGWKTIDVAPATVDRIYGNPSGVGIDELDEVDETQLRTELTDRYAALRAGSQSVLVRHEAGELVPMLRVPEPWGLRPRSKEQQFALDLLLDPEVRVVALDGIAGTGKTVLALAAGLEQVMEANLYDKVAVYRPVVPVGKAELGFLPGTLDEKLNPWMIAVHDALVALTERRSHADARAVMDELTERDKLSLEAVTYLRGRSLQGTYVLVDEAQNLEPTTLKTILTRVGEGTKVVFTGDTSQIDAPYLSEHNNAISVLIDAFDGERVFGHVRLSHCERSEVASLAALRL
ncbi:MAG: PhoH family protein [Actinomycetota bacterium]|nr:PhoH family protein [Actinomycetota bacterium]